MSLSGMPPETVRRYKWRNKVNNIVPPLDVSYKFKQYVLFILKVFLANKQTKNRPRSS